MTYVIAALDDNHNGDLQLARRLIDIAADSGCDAVKFIARTVDLSGPRTLLHRAFLHYPTLGRTVGEVRQRLSLHPDQHAALMRHAGGRIDYIIAPYDLPALESIHALGAQALQVDGAAATNLPLLAALARVAARIFAAVGPCTDREVEELVTALEGSDLTLLHTINGTPFRATLAHLRGVEALRRFGRPVGHGDSEPGFTLALAAVLLGVPIVEKRLTIDRTMEGPHHAQSLMPAELGEMVRRIRELETMEIDEVRRQVRSWEDRLTDERPSIVARVPIARGQRISADMLTLKPPLRGLSPRLLSWVVGRTARYDIEEDEFVTFGLVE